MNEELHIKNGNSLPQARGKPLTRQKVKGERQKAEFLHSFVPEFFPHLGGNVRRTKGVTLYFELCTLNLPDKVTVLLKMRDGPRSREPVNRLTNDGVPVSLITNHFVSLCVYFVYIVVNEIKLVIRYQSHTRQHRAMINLRKNKDFSLVLHGVCPSAGEKFSFF